MPLFLFLVSVSTVYETLPPGATLLMPFATVLLIIVARKSTDASQYFGQILTAPVGAVWKVAYSKIAWVAIMPLASSIISQCI